MMMIKTKDRADLDERIQMRILVLNLLHFSLKTLLKSSNKDTGR
jgi:hypothetical protein